MIYSESNLIYNSLDFFTMSSNGNTIEEARLNSSNSNFNRRTESINTPSIRLNGVRIFSPLQMPEDAYYIDDLYSNPQLVNPISDFGDILTNGQNGGEISHQWNNHNVFKPQTRDSFT
jgi:hypothetical protein